MQYVADGCEVRKANDGLGKLSLLRARATSAPVLEFFTHSVRPLPTSEYENITSTVRPQPGQKACTSSPTGKLFDRGREAVQVVTALAEIQPTMIRTAIRSCLELPSSRLSLGPFASFHRPVSGHERRAAEHMTHNLPLASRRIPARARWMATQTPSPSITLEQQPTPDGSVRTLLPLLAAQPSHYITIHIHGRPYLVTNGDQVRLPFRMPHVVPGDILRLNRASILGSRDYTVKGTPYVDQTLFECRAVVLGTEAEPMRVMIKKKQRTRRKKHVKSKHKYTILRIRDLKIIA